MVRDHHRGGFRLSGGARDALPLPSGGGWGEGRGPSKKRAPLTLSLSRRERGPAFALAALVGVLAANAHAADAARGRAIVADRTRGLCLLCHQAPIAEERFQGNLAPDLSGAGSRWTADELRLRIAAPRRLNPDTIMPSYGGEADLVRVGRAWQGKPLLSRGEIEDVVAYLATLKS